MKSNLFLRVIIAIVAIFLSASASAAPVSEDKALQWAEEKGRLLLDAFQISDPAKRFSELDRLLLSYVDLDYVSKFVVGKYWRSMTPEQQKTYQDVFRRYALGLYKTFPLDFADNITYSLGTAQSDGQFTQVSASVTVALDPSQPPQDFLLQFRLHQKDGKILLVDIKLAESSLILSYRGKFYEMIAAVDGEMEWFLEDLEMLTQSVERSNLRELGQGQ